MTYASDRGLKVGDKIRYLGLGEMFAEHPSYDVGDILILVFDDDSYNPIFRKVDGEVHSYFHLRYEWERVEEEKEMKLERTKEYSVMLTGEDIAHIYILTGCAWKMHPLYNKMSELSGLSDSVIEDNLIPKYRIDGVFVSRWLDSIFETPETEDERKLRELKEQYEYLGKAIEAMEKK